MAAKMRTANSHNSVQIFPSKVIIGSQVLRKCVDTYSLRHYYVFSRGYTDFDLVDDMKWDAPDEGDFRRLFLKTKELFDREGVKFSLAYGTLLGAVREGKPIKGDGDMDLFTWDEPSLIRSLPALQAEGLMCWRIYPGRLYSFTMNKSCFIDVYVLGELKGISRLFWGKSCVCLSTSETPRDLFTGWGEVEFLGEKCTCPANPERLLEFWYGPDWRIPQDKKGTYRVRSAEIYHRIASLPYRLPYLWYARQKARVMKAWKLLTNKEYRRKILQRKKETGSYFYRK